MLRRLLILIVCGALTACVGGSSFTASVISTLNTIGTGQQRVLVELRDADGQLLALNATPNATLRDENGSPLGVYSGVLVWVVPDDQPAYAFVVEVPAAETYQLTVDGGALGETPPAGLIAVEDTIQVTAGEAAPPVAGEDVDGPVLVVFASPDRCPSQSCQPMIDQVEAAADGSDVEWRRVEVFANPDVDAAADLELSADVEEWGLPSQPWLYAIDESGTIAAVFEGALTDEELLQAIELISN